MILLYEFSMPEGPSIVILKELASPFECKKVISVTGNSKTEKECALGQTVIAFKSWGKHFLICFEILLLKYILCYLALTELMKKKIVNQG
jgi:endonuclease-8